MVGMYALKASVEEATASSNDTYNNEDVSYQLFYNQTGDANGQSWEDVAEVFQQRQKELDPTGYFSLHHFYLVWEELSGNTSFTQSLLDSDVNVANFVNAETSYFIAAAASAIGARTSAAPTAADYTTQNAQLDVFATAGRKLVLIAHSQGNLFVNQAYDHIQPVVGSTRVKVVHIAPASTSLRGQYILSSFDSVINLLRADGGAVQPNNITIPLGTADPSGHELVNSYISTDPTRGNGRAQVEVLEAAAFTALTAPSGCAVTLTPSSSSIAPGTAVTLKVNIDPLPTDPVLSTEYLWTIAGTAGGSFPGGVTSATTTVPTLVYTVPASSSTGIQAPTQTVDVIEVKVLEAKMAGDQVNAVNLGTGSATVTVVPLLGNFQAWLGVWNCTEYPGTSYAIVYTATFTAASAPTKTYNLDYVQYSAFTNSTGYSELFGTSTTAVPRTEVGSTNPSPLFAFTGSNSFTQTRTGANVYVDYCSR